MSNSDDTLATRLADAMRGGEPRQVVLRFPCGCEIDSGDEGCAHADPQDIAFAGARIHDLNLAVSERVLTDPSASASDRGTAENYLYGVPPCQAIEEADAP